VKLCDFGSAKVLVWVFLCWNYYLSLSYDMYIRCIILILITFDRLKANQTYLTYVLGTIEHLNLFLVPLSTLLPLTSGLRDVFWLNYCLDR